MLSKNKMVSKAKKALESLYDGVCTVTKYQKVKKDNSSTGFEEIVEYKDLPCRLSFKSIDSTSQTENGASAIVQTTTLFLDPDVVIAPGSKITVTQNNMTTDYQHSGKAAVYSAHQEIVLDFFRGWS